MEKVKLGNALIILGNINRIAEMTEVCGDNAISGHFQDQNVNISPEFVRAIRTELHEFKKKSVSKAETKKVIQSIKDDSKNHHILTDKNITKDM